MLETQAAQPAAMYLVDGAFPTGRNGCTNSSSDAGADDFDAADALAGVVAASSSASQRWFNADLRAQRVCLDARAVG